MKTVTTYFTSEAELKSFVEQNDLLDSPRLLIQVFTGNNDSVFIVKITDFFANHYPLSHLIGSTTDGEIKDGVVSTKKTVISFTLFETVKLKTYISDKFENYFQAGQNLASDLVGDETKVIISFIDGLAGNGEEYLKGIHNIAKSVIVSGGLAGDNATFTNTYVFTKDKIFSHGVVGVSLSSSSLNVFTDYTFNWLAIGRKLTITKASGNRVYTIDNRTAIDAYTYYLGEDIGERLPTVGIEFPLIIEKDGLNIARAVIGREEDGSLIFAGNLNVGDEVRFGYGDIDAILAKTQDHIDKLYNIPVESIFVYSCMARRRFIPEEIEQETLVYNSIAPTNGFYTYGEFYSSSENKELLNQSMSILALSESSELNTKKTTFKSKHGKSSTVHALSHLISVSTQELEDIQKELKTLASTDPMTKLYNRRYFTDISLNFCKISQREKKPLSIIMLDIDKFKNINDTYGHTVGDLVLINLAELLQKSLRKSDIICRHGGEEFVVLLPETDLQGAAVVAEEIRKSVEKAIVQIEKNTIKFTISLGVSEINFEQEQSIEQALNRADEAMYESKNSGRNRVSQKR
ncbi:diguanylate cyclase [bacterium]|nr:diguanylate cyclase [bacterium]MBU1433701.1 diguanylate cyclase [bacterium]MBU1503776.1 diguanylate cyclase [bacterium]